MKREARILFFFGYNNDIRNLLISCYEEDMMNGRRDLDLHMSDNTADTFCKYYINITVKSLI